MSGVCSHSSPLLGAVGNLPHGPLDVFRQHLSRLVAALRPYLRVGKFGIAALGEAAMTEGGEREVIPQPGRTDNLLHLATHVGDVDQARLRPSGPGRALPPVAAQHQAADALALDGVQFSHQFRVEADTLLVEQRHPILLVGFGVQHADRIRVFLWPIVTHIKSAEDRLLALKPFPGQQCRGGERRVP